MSETATTPRQRGPWRKAFREARSIVLVSFVVAITYNIFATTSIPWLREASKHDSTQTATLNTAPDTASTNVAPSPPITTTAPIDTATTTHVDTVTVGMSAAGHDSLMKAQRDSVRMAKLESAHLRDSTEQANILAILASGKDINTDIARKIFDKKLAQFIDARPEDQYNEGHIVGAMNVYAEQWQSAIPDLVKIPKDRPIVTYCGGGDECELSRDLAKSLRTFGFKSVVVYTGGIKDWTAKKYPTAAGGQ